MLYEDARVDNIYELSFASKVVVPVGVNGLTVFKSALRRDQSQVVFSVVLGDDLVERVDNDVGFDTNDLEWKLLVSDDVVSGAFNEWPAYSLIRLDHLESAVVELAAVRAEAVEFEGFAQPRGATAGDTPLVDIAGPLDLAFELFVAQLRLNLDNEVARHHATVLEVGRVYGRNGQSRNDGAQKQRGVSVEASHRKERNSVS